MQTQQPGDAGHQRNDATEGHCDRLLDTFQKAYKRSTNTREKEKIAHVAKIFTEGLSRWGKAFDEIGISLDERAGQGTLSTRRHFRQWRND